MSQFRSNNKTIYLPKGITSSIRNQITLSDDISLNVFIPEQQQN